MFGWCKHMVSLAEHSVGQRVGQCVTSAVWVQVRPLRRQLKQLKAWITGQRKDQSPGTRSAVPVVQVPIPHSLSPLLALPPVIPGSVLAFAWTLISVCLILGYALGLSCYTCFSVFAWRIRWFVACHEESAGTSFLLFSMIVLRLPGWSTLPAEASVLSCRLTLCLRGWRGALAP